MSTTKDSMSSEPASGVLADSFINTTTRKHRSLLMLVLHMVLRPLRGHVGHPKKQQPEGSIELIPASTATKKCDVKHRTVCDINVYDIQPRPHGGPEETKKTKHIYYFCGGGWQSPPSSQHWAMCSKLARDLTDTVVTLVSYPLAPKNAAPTAFPWLLRFYREILSNDTAKDEKTILAGDSSGGNIVLSLVLEALREDEEARESPASPPGTPGPRPHPVAILAICPSTDLLRDNPAILVLARHDPLLTPPFIKETAAAWTADWDPTDRRVTPMSADTSLLTKAGIHVHGITAGHDILSPDGILFRKKLADAGVAGEWLHWEKQMHCYVLTYAYGLKEAKASMAWVKTVLEKE